MTRKTFLVSTAAGALLLAGILVASTRKPAADGKSPSAAAETAQVRGEEPKPLGIPVSNAVPTTELPEGTDAADVYQKLSGQIDQLSRQSMKSGSPEEQARAFDQIRTLLTVFRSRYAGTPEALDAAFQLGAMNYSMQNFDDAVKLLTEFIAKSDESAHEKVGYAHFYLAESSKGLGKYDEAEKSYKTVLTRYADVNPRLTQYTQTNLASLSTERRIAVGTEPIAFSVKGLKGEPLSPARYKGKVLLIDFWATWCGPCIAEMPNVKNVYGKYHNDGFEIVGISLDQSREKLDAYLKQNRIEWPQFFDGKWWNNEVAQMYGVQSIPTTLLVDRQGKIRYKSLRGKQLETAVKQLLAESS
jgi:thiol-disulfide isomerase/thioredoxin